MSKILLTGGSGKLGTELQKIMKVDAPSHKKLDITKKIKKGEYDLVIHAAGYTDVAAAEGDGENECFEVNVVGTNNIATAYWDVPFVFISSEYAKNPINKYGHSKAVAEKVVAAVCEKHLIIRTLFKPRPFPHKKAWINQWTLGDYVDVIAGVIKEEVERWDKQTSGMIYAGTGRKTMYDLAIRTRPSVEAADVDSVKSVRMPHDYL